MHLVKLGQSISPSLQLPQLPVWILQHRPIHAQHVHVSLALLAQDNLLAPLDPGALVFQLELHHLVFRKESINFRQLWNPLTTDAAEKLFDLRFHLLGVGLRQHLVQMDTSALLAPLGKGVCLRRQLKILECLVDIFILISQQPRSSPDVELISSAMKSEPEFLISEAKISISVVVVWSLSSLPVAIMSKRSSM